MTSSEKLLRDLIALPSVNPAFMPPNDPRAGERHVADFLTAIAARGGLEVERREVFPGRSNVLARIRPAGRVKRRVVLAPHMDTVGHAEMPDDLFRPVKKGDRLFGRGACDTKGSVAGMLTAMLNAARGLERPVETEIVFAALIDEENIQSGSRALVRDGFRADLAIVGEPTLLKVITAHKGDLWLTLRTRGKAAHGARPELGRNAVHAMARVVEFLETDYARLLKKKRHPLLGTATVNVGSIRGGTQPNIVPDWCEISIDRRTMPGETNAAVMREIRSLLRAGGFAVEVADDKSAAPCWPMETNVDSPLVQALMRIVQQRSPLGVHYFSDASVFARSGTPAILFGPGDIAQAHTADEWISLRSLERATAMLTRYLRSLA
ncbi:MAG TPA: ArgE/DapE family deacylase [Candidatus Limnocylindria bacterium]|nr:ArgE/DapE family deacylase [Candidatus Limnocylindria bacterium]